MPQIHQFTHCFAIDHNVFLQGRNKELWLIVYLIERLNGVAKALFHIVVQKIVPAVLLEEVEQRVKAICGTNSRIKLNNNKMF